MTEDKTFFREEYPWGRVATYQLPDGTLEYHYHGEVLSWEECQERVLRDWVPQSWADQADYRRLQASFPKSNLPTG